MIFLCVTEAVHNMEMGQLMTEGYAHAHRSVESYALAIMALSVACWMTGLFHKRLSC